MHFTYVRQAEITFITTFLLFLVSHVRCYANISRDDGEEPCPFGGEPAISQENQNILWCDITIDCPESYECYSTGKVHFGRDVRYCCPTRTSVCSLPPAPGYGDCLTKSSLRYYFDVTKLACTAFTFVGCNGENRNNFATLDECRNYCETTACQTGESLFKSENTRQAILCGDDGTCPSTHICRYDSLFRRHVCCGYKQSGTCAAGLRTYFNSLTAKPLSCTANQIKDECPPDFVCTWNVDSREHFCCSIDHGVCPAGQIPYNHPISKMTLKCNPLTYKDSCPMGYTCSVTVIGASWGFCCSTDIIANCPLNFVPFISPVTNEVQLCTVGVTVCSETGYECKNRDPQAIIGFCCSSSEIYTGMVVEPIQAKSQRDEQYFGSGIMRRLIEPPFKLITVHTGNSDIQKEIDASEKVLHDDYCPGDYAAWIYPGTNFPLLCNIQEDTCPENSTCVPNANNEAHCCIRQEVPEDRRMKPEETTSPETVVIDTDDPYCPRMVEERNCVPGSTLNCPEYGFFCQFNVIHQAYRCCSVLKP